jgi:hypothetical protein
MRFVSTILFAVLVALAANGQTRNACSGISLLGLRPGMTALEVKELLPSMKLPRADRFGENVAKFDLFALPNSAEWSGVQVGMLHFFDYRLYSINVVWQERFSPEDGKAKMATMAGDRDDVEWNDKRTEITSRCGRLLISMGIEDHSYADLTDYLLMSKLMIRQGKIPDVLAVKSKPKPNSASGGRLAPLSPHKP